MRPEKEQECTWKSRLYGIIIIVDYYFVYYVTAVKTFTQFPDAGSCYSFASKETKVQSSF